MTTTVEEKPYVTIFDAVEYCPACKYTNYASKSTKYGLLGSCLVCGRKWLITVIRTRVIRGA